MSDKVDDETRVFVICGLLTDVLDEEMFVREGMWITGGILSLQLMKQHELDNINSDIDILCDPKDILRLSVLVHEKLGVNDWVCTMDRENKYVYTRDDYPNIDLFCTSFDEYEKPMDLVRTFHWPCVRAIYNGRKLECMPSFILSQIVNTLFDLRYVATTRNTIDLLIRKYMFERRFSIFVPNYYLLCLREMIRMAEREDWTD